MARPKPKFEWAECPVRVRCDGSKIIKGRESCEACARALHRRKFLGTTDQRRFQRR